MPKNLLLADDSKTIQQAVTMTFAREDVALTTVEDGQSALQRAKEMKPDLILADVSMPGLGGYELCEKLRADASLKGIPVLLLGGGNPVDPSKAMAVGANGHMPKPFDSGKLIEQVKQILANPRAMAAAPAGAAIRRQSQLRLRRPGPVRLLPPRLGPRLPLLPGPPLPRSPAAPAAR